MPDLKKSEISLSDPIPPGLKRPQVVVKWISPDRWEANYRSLWRRLAADITGASCFSLGRSPEEAYARFVNKWRARCAARNAGGIRRIVYDSTGRVL